MSLPFWRMEDTNDTGTLLLLRYTSKSSSFKGGKLAGGVAKVLLLKVATLPETLSTTAEEFNCIYEASAEDIAILSEFSN